MHRHKQTTKQTKKKTFQKKRIKVESLIGILKRFVKLDINVLPILLFTFYLNELKKKINFLEEVDEVRNT